MNAETIIEAFARTARPVMLRFLDNDRQSCIAAARLTVETMKFLGLAAEPIPVKLWVQCEELQYGYISGFSKRERERVERRVKKPIQHRGVGGYNGHVIVGVTAPDEGRWLIDPSIDQIESRENGLTVAPTILVLPVADPKVAWKRVGVQLTAVIDEGRRVEIGYRARSDYSFIKAEAWEFCPAMQYVTVQLLNAMAVRSAAT
jgi:hypothetical protein